MQGSVDGEFQSSGYDRLKDHRYTIHIDPSYQKSENARSIVKVLTLVEDDDDAKDIINNQYQCERVYSSERFRIGPIFITKDKLSSMEANKPGKLNMRTESNIKYQSASGLLYYILAFMEQPGKNKIDLNFMKCLLDYGADINAYDEFGQSVLHGIVRDWHPDVARFALDYQADPNLQDNYGRSPLHLAAALNKAQVARVLLQNGGDPNLETFGECQTPVHYASKYNSVDVLRELLIYEGSTEIRDYRDRTALFVAAETGSVDTGKVLLGIGVPSSVYDKYGNSALAHMVERMPSVALLALEQYCPRTKGLNQCEMYLSALEFDVVGMNEETRAKSPLDVITSYRDEDLIMHPVIQASLALKWSLFGQKDAIGKLFIAFAVVICWMILTYLFEDDSADFYKTDGGIWKILLEVLIVFFTMYFFLVDVIEIKREVTSHSRWMEWKLHQVELQYVYCHPSWPRERQRVGDEVEYIKTIPSLVRKKVWWFVFECLQLILLTVAIATRAFAMIYREYPRVLVVHKIIISMNIIYASIRVLKITMRFKYVATYLKIVSVASTSFFQIFFFYLQIYIPFVAAFWLMFGNPQNQTVIHSNYRFANGTYEFTHYFYTVFTSSFEQEELYEFNERDRIMSQILISLFHLFTTFISLSIIISFIATKFATTFKRCHAEGSLIHSQFLVQFQKNLSKKERGKLMMYYRKNCTPLLIADQPLYDKLHARQAKSKIASLQVTLKAIYETLLSVEKTKLKIDIEETENLKMIYYGMTACVTDLQGKIRKYGKSFSRDLRMFLMKQSYLDGLILQLARKYDINGKES